MSSLYTKRGIYYYQRYTTDPDSGERTRINKSLRTRDQREAERLKKRWDDFYSEDHSNDDPIRVQDKMDQFLAERKLKVDRGELSESTLANDEYALNIFRQWIEEYCADGTLYVQEIESKDILRFKRHREKTVSVSTISNNLTALQTFFSWLFQEQIIDKHPFERIKIPSAQSRTKIPMKEEWGEIQRMSKKLALGDESKPLYVAFYILAHTGMRLGEALILKWERGSSDGGTGHSRKYAYLDGRNAIIYFKRNRRTIPLNHVWDGIMKLDRGDNIYLFESSHRPGNPLKLNGWSNQMSQLLTDLGFDDYTAHTLRHGFISQMVRDGHSLMKISKFVGHNHSAITSRYSHLAPTDYEDMLG